MLHIDGNDVVVGIYAGDGYSAETVDSGAATGDDRNATVERGDCVVYEVPDAVDRPLYTFVRTSDAWHRFAETDPNNRLTQDPGGKLGARTAARLEGSGENAKLVAGP